MEDKRHIGALFDRIAGSYDHMNHLLSVNIDKCWRRQAVRAMQPAQQVLDVAVGTGDLAIELLRRNKAETVTGVDLSNVMMHYAAEKAELYQLGHRLTLEQGNAQNLQYADNRFDAVTCAYGVRNFADLDAGLREMYRVLRPGGQLVILEFSYPTNTVIRWVYDLYFSHIMPLVGKCLSKDKTAYNYLCHSVKHFIWGEQMVSHLQQAGFKNVLFRPQTFGISTLYTATKP